MEMQKEEFVVWVRQAMNEKKSIAAQEMYHFLTQCFVRADKQMSGKGRFTHMTSRLKGKGGVRDDV